MQRRRVDVDHSLGHVVQNNHEEKRSVWNDFNVWLKNTVHHLSAEASQIYSLFANQPGHKPGNKLMLTRLP